MSGRGRPTAFRAEYVERIRVLCEAGMKDAEIAAVLGVSRSTLLRWQAARPELFAVRGAKHVLRVKGGKPRLYRPEFCERARELYSLGHNDAEVADVLGFAESTIRRWRRQYAEFGVAAAAGRASAPMALKTLSALAR
jgi:transposase